MLRSSHPGCKSLHLHLELLQPMPASTMRQAAARQRGQSRPSCQSASRIRGAPLLRPSGWSVLLVPRHSPFARADQFLVRAGRIPVVPRPTPASRMPPATVRWPEQSQPFCRPASRMPGAPSFRPPGSVLLVPRHSPSGWSFRAVRACAYPVECSQLGALGNGPLVPGLAPKVPGSSTRWWLICPARGAPDRLVDFDGRRWFRAVSGRGWLYALGRRPITR